MIRNVEIIPASPASWEQASHIIALGRLVVFPTDTVYGIGCDARNLRAIEAIYVAKGRERQKAIPLLLSGAGQLLHVTNSLPASAHILASRFWPGALTLIVPSTGDLPSELGGGDTVAVRVPDHDQLRRFIDLCGGMLAVTSANASGQPDALDATGAAAYFIGNDSVGLVIDGGVTPGSVPSTVIDCTGDPVRVLRMGALDPKLISVALYGKTSL